jgi:hypothetical protein
VGKLARIITFASIKVIKATGSWSMGRETPSKEKRHTVHQNNVAGRGFDDLMMQPHESENCVTHGHCPEAKLHQNVDPAVLVHKKIHIPPQHPQQDPRDGDAQDQHFYRSRQVPFLVLPSQGRHGREG